MTRESYCLDSHALLAHFWDESGAPKVTRLLDAARGGRVRALVCAVNLGEVYYVAAQRLDSVRAKGLLEIIRGIGVEVVPADGPLAVLAAEIRRTTALPYADAFAAALAAREACPVVTGDRDFRRVEGRVFGPRPMRVVWL